VLFRHVLRNSLGPTLSVAGLQLPLLFLGAIIIEPIFACPVPGA
jgi:peptide/nickel transport system permease protein